MQVKRKRSLSLSNRRSLFGYVFISPFIIGFIFLVMSPLLLYFTMAFNKISAGESGINLTFVKWQNYIDVLFEQQTFLQDSVSSLSQLLIMSLSILTFSFFIAIILNQKFVGRGLARTIFFLPVLVASGAAALSQNDTLSNSAITLITGGSSSSASHIGTTVAQVILNMLGLNFQSSFFSVVSTIMNQFYQITMMSGVQILIFLAALQTISPSLYEASSVEGATSWENFWKITFPMLSPMILVNAVYTIIDYMSSTSNGVVNEIYKYSVDGTKYGISSAMGTIYYGMVYMILIILFIVVSKFIVYEN